MKEEREHVVWGSRHSYYNVYTTRYQPDQPRYGVCNMMNGWRLENGDWISSVNIFAYTNCPRRRDDDGDEEDDDEAGAAAAAG